MDKYLAIKQKIMSDKESLMYLTLFMHDKNITEIELFYDKNMAGFGKKIGTTNKNLMTDKIVNEVVSAMGRDYQDVRIDLNVDKCTVGFYLVPEKGYDFGVLEIDVY